MKKVLLFVGAVGLAIVIPVWVSNYIFRDKVTYEPPKREMGASSHVKTESSTGEPFIIFMDADE